MTQEWFSSKLAGVPIVPFHVPKATSGRVEQPAVPAACVHHMLWLGVAPAVALPGARRRCRHRTRRVHVYTHFYTHVYARVYAQVLDARMPLFHFNHSMFEYPPAHAHAHTRAHASAIYTRLHTHPSWYSP